MISQLSRASLPRACGDVRASSWASDGVTARKGKPGFYLCNQCKMGLSEVLEFNRVRGISIPRRTDCMLCFFQRLWRDNLPAFLEGERFEAMTGFTWRSPGRDSWPAALKDLRAEFENGRIPRETRRDPLDGMQCRVCRK